MAGEWIHVVDNDAAALASLAAVLEAAGYRTRRFDAGAAFLDAHEPHACACVVLDVKMPGLDGLEVQRRLRARPGAAPAVVMVTGHGDIPMAVQAMREGAADFLEKPVSRAQLLESVARAIAGGRGTEAERGEVGARLQALTARERKVLEQLMMGHTNKAAARILGISARTIEIYRRNVMVKMGAQSLSHLVRMTLLAGLDPLGDAAPARTFP